MTNFFTHKFREKSPAEIIGTIIFGGIFIAGLATLFAYIVMRLWNWLMPELFGLTTLSFWQAVGLIILFKLLLGCSGFGGKSSSKKSKHHSKKKSKTDFSKWKHYDQFWKEEGDEYFRKYIERQNQQSKEGEEDKEENKLDESEPDNS
ncbi:hypothetical protein POV27_13125 [Aureisphaera galaxeae]|uniref:hypothetical protein n=1 Tax=Aureisphaera galaxeae TaxID=1538023 RepID=UPI00234FE186|nr:hypothetical protein [Aureisphaera galaxeae]MDC8004998.1 hypothetical protein [Aureisphaera galaxeae]